MTDDVSRIVDGLFVDLSLNKIRLKFSGDFYRASSYASAVLAVAILSVCLSVRPSVIRALCDKTK